MEVDVYGVADGYLGCVSQDLAGGVGGDGVAAFEDAEGAAFVELEVEAVEALAFLAEGTVGAGGQFELEFFQTQTDGCDFHSEIESDDAFVRDVEALGTESEICTKSVGEA